MTGILNKLSETKTVNVKCASCGEPFGLQFNPTIDGSYYHAIKNDGTRIREISTIHMRSWEDLSNVRDFLKEL
jgi:hypothetical protein